MTWSHREALREIIQEIALLGLYRGNFFDRACFYGGTALRIFYGLDRLSNVRLMTEPYLFVGKVHALLCREWGG